MASTVRKEVNASICTGIHDRMSAVERAGRCGCWRSATRTAPRSTTGWRSRRRARPGRTSSGWTSPTSHQRRWGERV